MDTQSYDIAVIGLGPGGEMVAGRLAREGVSVLAVDHRLVGGECPYWGCIPSKMMVRAAGALAEARYVPRLAGRTGDIVPDWGPVADRIRDEATDDWDDTAAVDRLVKSGAAFVRGTGRIRGPHEIEVDEQIYRVGRGIVVNTGTTPLIPPIEGIADVDAWTNHDLVEARELPASMVILGGGTIGCEFGQALARFGVTVAIVEAGPRLLAHEEPEASDRLRDVFDAEGIEVRLGAAATKVTERDGHVELSFEDGTTVTGERLLVAVGRRVDPSAVGLDRVGVDPTAQRVPVDDRCRVTDQVWAVGDITGKGAFTHVSMYQAAIVVRDVLEQDGPAADYRAVPRVTFTDPEIGAVGLTEAQAREQGIEVRTGTVPIAETSRGFVHGPGGEGVLKVVSDADRSVLVGATAMGPAGGEVLGALSVAVHAEVPLEVLRSMIFAYPTFHRGIETALGGLD
ncbi:MAG: NAD(P)/FAD-dependent oxidoreductase [Intrasporangium sp.]|uniref:dihydrolipoyl dehydrogenase family protein n=1 Tax=Intrasporangium sp. TaxID=1925024 RepID=UPI0026475EDC|nr:NAD(P)/FAD-dependent oxidoreductase [Intrasporangium sp.]MDN5794811.1 NAD(P)/FAD-dependent oxidoreductase [Intrasporangium sp.]